MRRIMMGLCLVLTLGCSCVLAAAEDVKMITVTGKLVRVAGIGGETTGWAVKLETALKMEGKEIKSIEANDPARRLENLENKRVEVTGTLAFRNGVERGYWRVLEVSAIKEIRPR